MPVRSGARATSCATHTQPLHDNACLGGPPGSVEGKRSTSSPSVHYRRRRHHGRRQDVPVHLGVGQ